MNWKLAVAAFSLLTVTALAQTVEIPIPTNIGGSTTITGPSPWLDVKAWGAVGNGTADDQPAIQAAIDHCPNTGCTIYFPSSTSVYKIHTGLTISSSQVGVKLLGECGASGHGSNETCSRIASGNSSIVLLTVGSAGMDAFDSGLVIQDLGFQDTGGGVISGAIDLVQTKDFSLINIHCRDINIGYCMLFDGTGTGDKQFTQFGVVINPKTVNVKYPVKIASQVSEINFFGGDFSCTGAMGVPIANAIGMNLVGTGGHSAGGEFGVFGTHMINCLTGISMFNMANLNYYGIMEMQNPLLGNDGIIIGGDATPPHADKNTISGSIDGFSRGVTLGATTNNRILANITNTTTPIVASGTALSTAFILTPINYPAGSGGVDVGTQIPTDVTIPHEAIPVAPLSGSRRIYVDMNSSDDLIAERFGGTAIDLESGLRNYQKALPGITGNPLAVQTIYTFSVPFIPPGKGIRARVFWQCTSSMSGAKAFSWSFGGTAVLYGSYTNNTNALTSAEVRIFNDPPSSQTAQTMFVDPIVQSTSLLSAGNVANPAESTNAPVSLTFRFQAPATEVITPKGFIVEAIQ